MKCQTLDLITAWDIQKNSVNHDTKIVSDKLGEGILKIVNRFNFVDKNKYVHSKS